MKKGTLYNPQDKLWFKQVTNLNKLTLLAKPDMISVNMMDSGEK